MKINPQIFQANNNVVSTSKSVSGGEIASQPALMPPQAVVKQEISGLYILQKLENLNKLSDIQRLMFLKEMLNLPEQWKDFLIFASLKSNQNSAQANKLLEQLLNLNILKDELNKSSNEMLNKLLKLLTPQMTAKTSEMSQMLEVLQKFLPSSDIQSSQMLKDLILMYLPYLPLKEDLKLLLCNKKYGSDDEKEEDSSIIIILTTKNMGTFKIEIYLENSDVKIHMENNSDKLNRRFLNALKELKKKLDISENISLSKNKNLQSSNEQIQNIVSSSPKVHPKVLMAAYEIIKTILEIDNTLSLATSRKNS